MRAGGGRTQLGRVPTGFKELAEGARVDFQVTQGPKGPQAEHVVPIG
ncbi:cold shock domain-containing protein [Streptomyces sp. 205]|uniref:Cold shock domain-containing protein n=1 Tax=Streptomyces coffeae TaxID=621382 RepID=A0ABS1NE34_9ACTN|nr:cold shock domain-containing protein [Streptomyces coffeae]